MIEKDVLKQKLICLIQAETAQTPDCASAIDFWRALSRAVMELLTERWQSTQLHYKKGRQAHYFSAEFLEGRSLLNNLINLDLYDIAQETVQELGHSLSELEESEADPGLGNGGLGRLAACFLDSAATQNLPVRGYGILYRYGLFRQAIENGFQKEYPDAWMEEPYPFIVRRNQDKVRVHFQDLDVIAVPYDLPVTGYQTENINTLRLWKAEPAEEFDFNLFNSQRFDDAVTQRNRVEDICRVLYPNDSSYDGKVLRVRQQYFFVSASLQTIISDYIAQHGEDLTRFGQFNHIQLNDTHPVLAIPELMRLLMDEHNLSWQTAWSVTQTVFAYTNHTIMAEALEKWDIGIFQYLFPRVFQIIEQIDAQFRRERYEQGLHDDQIRVLAPLGDGKVHMAHLAIYGSHSVNGVAAVHTDILKTQALKGFYQVWPERFNNKTNGVTPRRWIQVCNPELAELLTSRLGSNQWLTDLERLAELKPLAQDKSVLRQLLAIKRNNKQKLADFVQVSEQLTLNPDALFDVQIKRLHEYKRQLMNALLILDDYFTIKEHPEQAIVPCTYFFGAKAAPGYFKAKAIIKFINEVACLVNNDPDVNQWIKVVFLQNYNISKAEKLFPAADLSEQISTVGMEASGTGNMKFMMNGALTIGTCDGANVEIAEAAGRENCYLFGCQVEHFVPTKAYYNPQWQYEQVPGLKRCVDTLINGTLSDMGTGMFRELYNGLIYGSSWEPADPYYVLGDFDEYRRTRRQAQKDYTDPLAWAARCWINITSSGRFSSDRTINDYGREIWDVDPRPIR
ncbi:MAG: glycogen/starch/alpha-glucan phosphorylase [Clostridiaceae bacterium]|jgi:starch phosphorylase|nr:glycogen/starch/alpha-glucan phosphorylase [Eubacteriales bacterium]NLV47160.1 glycogen/starch/alpha-glucan phosphorylase [Clostridiaceae bacterium]